MSGCGLLLGALVGAMAPNTATLPIKLPLTKFLQHYFLPSLLGHPVITFVLLYAGDILACLGLAGMLWAHSQGWRPDPRKLLLVSAGVVAVLVSLTPVGSSDTASYAAFGRISALGGNPYTDPPLSFLRHSSYLPIVGHVWQPQVSDYGPIATWLQRFAASIGGASPAITIWVLMILNGLVFIGIGWLLLRTSDDPIRATLLWVANPVLIQQLVSGGHLDTFVAAACICAIQVARRVTGLRGDVLTGVLIGLALRRQGQCAARRGRPGLAHAPAARVDADRPDHPRVDSDGRRALQRLRSHCAQATRQCLEVGDTPIAMAAFPGNRRYAGR